MVARVIATRKGNSYEFRGIRARRRSCLRDMTQKRIIQAGLLLITSCSCPRKGVDNADTGVHFVLI